MGITVLTQDNFDEEVLHADKPVLVDFWASWCGPCRMQSPIVDAVAEDMGDAVKICKLNVDEQPTVAADFAISSIPTLVFIKNGEVFSRMVGLQDKPIIVNTLKTMLDV